MSVWLSILQQGCLLVWEWIAGRIMLLGLRMLVWAIRRGQRRR